jgi:hypothetical protein
MTRTIVNGPSTWNRVVNVIVVDKSMRRQLHCLLPKLVFEVYFLYRTFKSNKLFLTTELLEYIGCLTIDKLWHRCFLFFDWVKKPLPPAKWMCFVLLPAKNFVRIPPCKVKFLGFPLGCKESPRGGRNLHVALPHGCHVKFFNFKLNLHTTSPFF